MGGNPSLSLSSHFFSTFVLVLVSIFNFIFTVCFDLCCCFSISFLGTKEKGSEKEEIQLQSNSKNEDKNATEAKFPLSFSFPSYDCFSFTDVHAMYIDFHHFFHEHVEFY